MLGDILSNEIIQNSFYTSTNYLTYTDAMTLNRIYSSRTTKLSDFIQFATTYIIYVFLDYLKSLVCKIHLYKCWEMLYKLYKRIEYKRKYLFRKSFLVYTRSVPSIATYNIQPRVGKTAIATQNSLQNSTTRRIVILQYA